MNSMSQSRRCATLVLGGEVGGFKVLCREFKNKCYPTYLLNTKKSLEREVFLADISTVNVSCHNKFNALFAKLWQDIWTYFLFQLSPWLANANSGLREIFIFFISISFFILLIYLMCAENSLDCYCCCFQLDHWNKWLPVSATGEVKSTEEGFANDILVVTNGPLQCLPAKKHATDPKLHAQLLCKAQSSE